MQLLTTVGELREELARWRADDKVIGFIPTMGNLHDGHLSLIDLARQKADRVVASVYVNPAQFGPNEDYKAYPRTLDADRDFLADRQCDLLFAPEDSEMYPQGTENHSVVRVPGLSSGLCSDFRPGHFDGVATMVAKLFGIVQPDLAVFGLKDYQQLKVILKLVEDLALPIDILAAPIVRENDGLAMSSRNRYLDPDQRLQAPALYAALCEVRGRIQAGEKESKVLAEARARIADAGMEPEYVELRSAENLQPAGPGDAGVVVLAAARIGAARLIDNVVFHR